jgi:hypothetical protein
MFQHPSHTAQFAADHRLARRAEASRRRNRRAAVRVDRLAADIGEHVAAVGLGEARADVDTAIDLARRLGVGRSLTSIVTDPAQPPVARERALGRLLVVVAATVEPTATRADEPAA